MSLTTPRSRYRIARSLVYPTLAQQVSRANSLHASCLLLGCASSNHAAFQS